MATISSESDFAIGATEAPSYRRIALQAMHERGLTDAQIAATPLAAGFGIRDGSDVAFVSKTGEVYPTCFLPLSGGNVRQRSLRRYLPEQRALYRHSRSLQIQRPVPRMRLPPDVRRFARTRVPIYRDPLQSDALCTYQPEPVVV